MSKKYKMFQRLLINNLFSKKNMLKTSKAGILLNLDSHQMDQKFE